MCHILQQFYYPFSGLKSKQTQHVLSYNDLLLKIDIIRYRALHGFGQIVFPNGGFVLFCFRLEPIFTSAPAAFKNDALFESGKNLTQK